MDIDEDTGVSVESSTVKLKLNIKNTGTIKLNKEIQLFKLSGAAVPSQIKLPVIRPNANKFLNFKLDYSMVGQDQDTSHFALSSDSGKTFFGDVLMLKYNGSKSSCGVRLVDFKRI